MRKESCFLLLRRPPVYDLNPTDEREVYFDDLKRPGSFLSFIASGGVPLVYG